MQDSPLRHDIFELRLGGRYEHEPPTPRSPMTSSYSIRELVFHVLSLGITSDPTLGLLVSFLSTKDLNTLQFSSRMDCSLSRFESLLTAELLKYPFQKQ